MFSVSRAALRSSRQSAIARPLATAFSPSTFVNTKSRPSNLSELRSFESLLQRYNTNYGSGYRGESQGGRYGNQGGGYGNQGGGYGNQGGGYGNQGGGYGGNQGSVPRNNNRGYNNNNAGRAGFGDRKLTPTKVIYIGNLQFEVDEHNLRDEFKAFGPIQSTKIIYDARGMSKGFGYVEFETIEQATSAIEASHNGVLMGRRMNVQYVHRPTNGSSEPSKTLFIGNLSFDMTDADFDRLFTDIHGCVDVRIAMDRSTGQPRGFAHADFVDINSAVQAKEKLTSVEVFGRRLRIDFSDQRGSARGGRGYGDRGYGDPIASPSPPSPPTQGTFEGHSDASEGHYSNVSEGRSDASEEHYLDASGGHSDASEGRYSDASEGHYSDASEGRSDASEGHLDASEGRSDASEGRSDASEGRSDASEGRSDASEGRSDASERHSDASEGHSDVSEGRSDASEGHYSDASEGRSDASEEGASKPDGSY